MVPRQAILKYIPNSVIGNSVTLAQLESPNSLETKEIIIPSKVVTPAVLDALQVMLSREEYLVSILIPINKNSLMGRIISEWMLFCYWLIHFGLDLSRIILSLISWIRISFIEEPSMRE